MTGSVPLVSDNLRWLRDAVSPREKLRASLQRARQLNSNPTYKHQGLKWHLSQSILKVNVQTWLALWKCKRTFSSLPGSLPWKKFIFRSQEEIIKKLISVCFQHIHFLCPTTRFALPAVSLAGITWALSRRRYADSEFCSHCLICRPSLPLLILLSPFAQSDDVTLPRANQRVGVYHLLSFVIPVELKNMHTSL